MRTGLISAIILRQLLLNILSNKSKEHYEQKNY